MGRRRCKSCGLRSPLAAEVPGVEVVCGRCLRPLVREVRRRWPGFLMFAAGGLWVVEVEAPDRMPRRLRQVLGLGRLPDGGRVPAEWWTETGEGGDLGRSAPRPLASSPAPPLDERARAVFPVDPPF